MIPSTKSTAVCASKHSCLTLLVCFFWVEPSMFPAWIGPMSLLPIITVNCIQNFTMWFWKQTLICLLSDKLPIDLLIVIKVLPVGTNESPRNSSSNTNKQESPPAWTQEAYRPLCSKYSLCCPNWLPPRQGTPQAGYPPCQGTPPGQGTPCQGTPPGRVPPQGTLRQGTPLGRVPPHQGTPPAGPGRVPPPPAAPWHFGKCCKALWDTGTPPCGQTDWWMDGQTRVKTLPSRRTTYAGGNQGSHWNCTCLTRLMANYSVCIAEYLELLSLWVGCVSSWKKLV